MNRPDEMSRGDIGVRNNTSVLVGAGFDAGRLDCVIDMIGRSAEVLRADGVRAGLHNHIGTWIETEHEIEPLAAIPTDLLGASFDIGHLAWAGIDPVAMVRRHADRVLGLHLKDLDLSIAERSRLSPTPCRAATDDGIFLKPSLNDLDLDAVRTALTEERASWTIIEVDRASMDPIASAAVSWERTAARLR